MPQPSDTEQFIPSQSFEEYWAAQAAESTAAFNQVWRVRHGHELRDSCKQCRAVMLSWEIDHELNVAEQAALSAQYLAEARRGR